MRRTFCLLLCLSLLIIPVSGDDETKYAALTFDDGPSGRFTRQLLDGLKERDAKATFLLCGYRIREYPQEAERIVQEGHEVGNHGFSHKNMQAMSHRQIAQEIMDTQALLPPGAAVHFLRPPGGCCSTAVSQVAEARQLAILSWSVDPKDWATDDTAAIVESVCRQTKDGDIILLHDMSDSSVQAALQIIDRLSRQGYRFVTVSELARLRHIRPKPGKSYQAFPAKT